MKRFPALLYAGLLCFTLAGCAYDPYAPPVSGSMSFGPGGIYGGTVSVGTAYYPTPLLFPVLPPPRLYHAPRYYHAPPPPRYYHAPPPRPLFRPAPYHGHRPPAVRPHGGPRPPALGHVPAGPHGHRPPAVRPGGPGMHRPPTMRPDNPGRHGVSRPALRPAPSPAGRPAAFPRGGHHGPSGHRGGPR